MNHTTSYCLAQDLLVLATKTYKNGDIKGAAKLFAHACSSKDLPVFVNRALETAGDKGLTLPIIKRRTLATIEAAFVESAGPIPLDDLKKIVSALKSNRVVSSSDPDTGFIVTTPDEFLVYPEDAEDFDEELVIASTEMDGSGDDDFSLDAEDEEDPEELDACSDCGSDPCECDFEADGAQEEELSGDGLYDSIKNSLVSLKVRANDWEVKEFMPTLLQFFPDLATGNVVSTRDVVNKIINRLHQIPVQELYRLDRMLIPLREG